MVSTKNNNTLSTFITGLSYPTGIYKNGANIVVHDFIERKAKRYNSSGVFLSDSSLTSFDFPKIDSFSKNVLKTPLKRLDINLSGNLLNLYMEYYKIFSCE
jgi:hypothetical protein